MKRILRFVRPGGHFCFSSASFCGLPGLITCMKGANLGTGALQESKGNIRQVPVSAL